MSEGNHTPSIKIENFLQSALESEFNFNFKSPSKDKKYNNMESIPISWRRTPIMSPIGNKLDLQVEILKEKTQTKNKCNIFR